MKKPNRLINEKSPYLLQHAHNPVDWYVWSEEAFEKAKKEDKPVFLSIGYSTCHWCHVMEHESFENEEVAALMNDAFVSIKVDREERPDIDGIYMNVCQMLTGSGGWPLTIIMTPDKKPFFAGTYFPGESRYGRTGMEELVPGIKHLWQTKRGEILKSANEITNSIIHSSPARDEIIIEENIFDKAFNEFKRRYDYEYGGFGSAPKFPTPHNLIFLMRYWKRKKEPEALMMVEETLQSMRSGGIYDHTGFGFHRYSTDREWLVPHFEKMLYDQALIVPAYIEAYQITKNIFYKDTAEEILTYVKRDMTSPEGAFYSAEDADSEGEEGKFYLWQIEELKQALSGDEANLAVKIFNVENGGNLSADKAGWIDHMHGGTKGANILHMKKKFNDSLNELDISPESFNRIINTIREKLFNFREKKVHPYKDDKILTDWNSLMISAFARAYQVFGNEKYLTVAEDCAAFILTKMKNEKGLLHRYRDGEAGIAAHLDDYAFFISALLDLYESSFNVDYLKAAIELNDYLVKHFWDNEGGGFFFTSDESEKLLARQKEIYDGAVPSGNSIEMLNLLRLGRLTSGTGYESYSSEIGKAFAESITASPSAYTQMLAAIDFAFGPAFEIVFAGNKNSDGTRALIKVLREKYLPNKTLLLKDPGDDEIINIAPFTKDQVMIDGKASVYVCRNFSCGIPVTSVKELEELLSGL